MRQTGRGPELLNLGSTHYGWLRSALLLLEEITDEDLERAVPAVHVVDLWERLHSLKYICLVDDLLLSESRQALPERTSASGFGNEDLYGLLGRLEDAPLSREDDPPTWLEPEDLEPAGQSSELFDGSLQDARRAAERKPHHGEITEDRASGGRGVGTNVVVDCYGMYVESLYGWCSAISRWQGNTDVEERFLEQTQYEETDGPAILLSPESISSLYRLVMGRAPSLVLAYLSPEVNPHRLFFKLVLLHELGHHFYPAHRLASKNVSEAFANWFAYGLLNPNERAVMYEMAKSQTLPYRMYEGLISMLHPAGPPAPWVAISPWNALSGDSFVKFLELAAFEGVLGDAAAMSGPPWAGIVDEIAEEAEAWAAASGTPQLQRLLRSMVPGSGLQTAKVFAWILLSEAIPGPGGELAGAMSDLQYAGSGPWRPASKMRQYTWLETVWTEPRRRL